MSSPERDPAPALVPELLVTDIETSLAFWCGSCGFVVEYARPEDGFAYLSSGTAHVMLEQAGVIRNWITAELERPFGRGINFQIGVDDLDPILDALAEAGHALYLDPEVAWYRVSERGEVGVRQFLVSDPDGYLIRFQTSLGRRTISAS